MLPPIPSDPTQFLQWRREHFPYFERKICLTHASVSPLPAASGKAVADHAWHLARAGQFDELTDGTYDRCKQRIARMLGAGAKAEEVAFAGSTSHALGLVATSFPWKAGENCIVADGDFPANVVIWKNLAHTHGVETRLIPHRPQMDLTLDDVLPLIDEKTRLVSLSAVNFLSGCTINLKEIGAALHARGIKFCVDGIQALGAVRLDLSEVDFICADAHKWLLGPNGAAFMWARTEALETMRPQILGWLAIASREKWFSYDTTPIAGGERFEPGSRNYLGIVGMEASLAILEEAGAQTVEDRIVALRDYGAHKLEAVGCQLLWKPDPAHRSGIFSFQIPGVDLNPLYTKLEEKFALSIRQDRNDEFWIRVSPHFMNCEGDVDELAAEIGRLTVASE